MTIDAIRLQNFMAFEDTGWLELRPITLLFGRNSSGKSAFIRALLLLRQSLNSAQAGDPFLFESPHGVDIGGFKEMVHNGQVDGHVWFHFRCSSSDIQVALEKHGITAPGTPSPAALQIALGYAAQRETQEKIDLSRIELADLQIRLVGDDQENGSLLFQTGLLKPEDVGLFEGERRYVEGLLTHHGQPGAWMGFDCKLARGFLDLEFIDPQAGAPDDYQCLKDLFRILKEEVAGFLQNIVHLGPIRPEPQRRYSFDRTAASEWRARDWTAFFNLIGGKLGQDKIEEINAWLRRLRLAVGADPRPASEIGALVAEFEIAIKETDQSSPLPLSAMGFGTAQVLPVIVQCVTADPGTLVIVEQPELHLHPRGQAWLGDLYPAVIRRDIRAQRRSCREAIPPRPPKPSPDTLSPSVQRYLLETHSEHFLLRLRRCIAETHLKSLRNKLETPDQDAAIPELECRPLLWPGDTAVYFVDRPVSSSVSRIVALEIDRFGDLPSQPQGFAEFFSDDAKEILALTKAALTAEGLEENRGV